jgi:WD40 repeat protein
MGFNTSDIIWYEPMSQKYARLNKNGQITDSLVQSILWLPNKENLFIAAHMNGTLIVYDKEKEDANFVAEEALENGHVNGDEPKYGFRVKKSVQSRDQKVNPVAVWKVSNMKINGMAFSPDGQMLAVVCEDGTLTIIDYINERVLDVYRSYYGAMLCVTWSPDGRYVLTGGQDDLVSIWSLADQSLVARCVGHESWVMDVKFDPWRCDERNYRFGSVGEDCRLLLWDFSVGMLRRPRVRNRNSMSSNIPGGRKESLATVSRYRSNSSRTQSDGIDGEEKEVEVVHAVDAMADTALLPPVMSKNADTHPLCWLGFEESCIITSCQNGHVREWERPKDDVAEEENRKSSIGSSIKK